MALHSLPGHKTLKFTVKDRSGDCVVRLSDDTPLGHVQAVSIHASVGELSRAVVETICTEAEVEVLQLNTDVKIEIRDMDAYGRGYDFVAKNGPEYNYEPSSYAAYLYDRGRKQAFDDRVDQHVAEFKQTIENLFKQENANRE